MQKGSLFIVLGLATLIAGVLALKLTDLNYFWALIALGAVVGVSGGIRNSLSARA